MDPILVIDLGNSRASIAVFLHDEIVKKFSVKNNKDVIKNLTKTFREISTLCSIKNIYISSVTPSINEKISKIAKKIFKLEVHFLTIKDVPDLKIIVDDPNEVGGDIIADSYHAKLQNEPTVVVDLGTVTKFVFTDSEGTFIGTSFFPGIKACVSSLTTRTELLPKIFDFSDSQKIIGNNTYEAIQTGLLHCTVSYIKEFVNKVEVEKNIKFKKILTGGYSSIIGKYLPDYIVDEDFVFNGIYKIFKR